MHAEDLVLVEHCFGSDYLRLGGTRALGLPLCLHMEFDGHVTLWLFIISSGAVGEARQPLTNISGL